MSSTMRAEFCNIVAYCYPAAYVVTSYGYIAKILKRGFSENFVVDYIWGWTWNQGCLLERRASRD